MPTYRTGTPQWSHDLSIVESFVDASAAGLGTTPQWSHDLSIVERTLTRDMFYNNLTVPQ